MSPPFFVDFIVNEIRIITAQKEFAHPHFLCFEIKNKPKMNTTENTDFFKGAKLACENAQKLFTIAKQSKEISFGISNSLLILAAEEAIKSDFLAKVAINPNWLEYKNIKKYFSSHIFKHQQILQDQKTDNVIMAFADQFSDLFGEGNGIKTSEDEMEKLMKKREQQLDRTPGLLIRFIRRKANQKKTDKSWINNANAMKNRGFYIGYNEDGDSWNGPFEISEDQFEESSRIVSERIKKAQSAIETAEDDREMQIQ